MKIAIIGPAYPFRGGIAAFSERLALEMQVEGHDVTIYTFTLQYPSFLFPGKTQYTEDPPPQNLKIIQSINSVNPINWWKVGNQIRKENYDLVIPMFWLPFMGASFGTILNIIKKNKNTKILSLVHNLIPHESRIGDHQLTQYFTKQVDAFIVLTKSVLDDVHQFMPQKPKAVSPHPIYDSFGYIADKATAQQKINIPFQENLILFFGLIRDYKGLDLLIEAMADERIRDLGIKLVIAGEYYSNKEKYLNAIQTLQLQNDIFISDRFIPDSEVANYFNACDLVVQPYRTATQSGVTQIAYHFDKPMIVTKVGGLEEMCPDGKVGYVVQPEPKAIADGILRFFTDTDKEKMKADILEQKKKYSWKILVDNIFQLLNQT